MSKQNDVFRDYVKKNTMMVTALVCLVAGFMGGIVLSAYKAGSAVPLPASMPQQQTGAPQELTADNADRILILEKAVSSNPDDVEAWTRLGNIYFDTQQHQKAIAAYEKSLAISPDNADVLTDLGVMYRRNGQPKKAIETFDKAVRANPFHEVSRFNKGVVLMHDLNDSEGALQAWEELVKMNPLAKAPNGLLLKEMVAKLKHRSN